MKKILIYVSIVLTGFYFIFLSSCGGDGEMSYENTFNLESLDVNPSADINDNFIITYGVTTKGFPQFLFDIYLSNRALIKPLRSVIEHASSKIDTNLYGLVSIDTIPILAFQSGREIKGGCAWRLIHPTIGVLRPTGKIQQASRYCSSPRSMCNQRLRGEP